MTGVRRKTAEHLSHAWSQIPHVTQFDKADMTVLEEIRPKYCRGSRACRRQADGDRGADQDRRHRTEEVSAVQLVDRHRQRSRSFTRNTSTSGLPSIPSTVCSFPVVRNADQKNILQIAVEIHQLAEKAKARKLSLDEMTGGSMSITNLGGIGGTAFTPIVNWPEVAILGVSRGAQEPVYRNGVIEPRQMLPLSLSYDHRVIDGADAIRSCVGSSRPSSSPSR